MIGERTITYYPNTLRKNIDPTAEPTAEVLAGRDWQKQAFAAGDQVPDPLDGDRISGLQFNTEGSTAAPRVDVLLKKRERLDFVIVEHNLRTTYGADVFNLLNLKTHSSDDYASATAVTATRYVARLLGRGRGYGRSDGVDDKVVVASSSQLDVGQNEPFSLDFWVNETDSTGSELNTYISRNTVGSSQAWFFRYYANSYQFYVHDGGNWQSVLFTASKIAGTNHYTLTRDGSTLTLYRNGVSLGSATFDYAMTNTFDLWLGGREESGASFLGSLIVYRWWNRALSTAEVVDRYNHVIVPAADKWGNQTDLVTNGDDWTGATGSTPPTGWSDSGTGTVAYLLRNNTGIDNMDDKTLEIQVSGSGSKTLYQGCITNTDKRHGLRFAYRNLNGSSPTKVYIGTKSYELTHTLITGPGIIFHVDEIPADANIKFEVFAGGILQIDGVTCRQTGCVAAWYFSTGMNPKRGEIYDRGEHGLTGTVTGVEAHLIPDAGESEVSLIKFDEVEALALYLELNDAGATGDATEKAQVNVVNAGRTLTASLLDGTKWGRDKPGVSLAESKSGVALPTLDHNNEVITWLVDHKFTDDERDRFWTIWRDHQDGDAWPFYVGINREDTGEEIIYQARFTGQPSEVRDGTWWRIKTNLEMVGV